MEKDTIDFEAAKNLLKQYEIDNKEQKERINELERIVQKYEKNEEIVAEFKDDQIVCLQNQLNSISENVKYLQERYFKVNAEKHYYKNQLSLIQASDSGKEKRKPSDIESENIELKSELSRCKEENSEIIKKTADLEKQLEKRNNEIKKLRQTAIDKFDILQKKLHKARDGNQELKEKEKEIETLESTIHSYEESIQTMNDSSKEFINSIGLILGCDTLESIVEKIKQYSHVETENSQLKVEINELQSVKVINQNESYESTINALKQVRDGIAPDTLKLPQKSPLRQLFASLYNMINSTMSQTATLTILQPHIRAVLWQAQAFSPEKQNIQENKIELEQEIPSITEPKLKGSS